MQNGKEEEIVLGKKLYERFVQAVDDWAIENGVDKEGDERFIKALMSANYNFFSANIYFVSDDEDNYIYMCEKIYEMLLKQYERFEKIDEEREECNKN